LALANRGHKEEETTFAAETAESAERNGKSRNGLKLRDRGASGDRREQQRTEEAGIGKQRTAEAES
jgi:hypothetical protein